MPLLIDLLQPSGCRNSIARGSRRLIGECSARHHVVGHRQRGSGAVRGPQRQRLAGRPRRGAPAPSRGLWRCVLPQRRRHPGGYQSADDLRLPSSPEVQVLQLEKTATDRGEHLLPDGGERRTIKEAQIGLCRKLLIREALHPEKTVTDRGGHRPKDERAMQRIEGPAVLRRRKLPSQARRRVKRTAPRSGRSLTSSGGSAKKSIAGRRRRRR